MVDRRHCTKCGELGRIPRPDADPVAGMTADDWMDCPHCRGTGVEMAVDGEFFEVYVSFKDEVEAREYMKGLPLDRGHGIRRVEGEFPGDRMRRMFGWGGNDDEV